MDLNKYGIHIERTADRPCFQLTNIEKLSGATNRGRHNIFVRVWDKDGNRDRTPTLRIYVQSIAGKQLAPLDKGEGPIEYGHGDVPMWINDTYTVSIVDVNSDMRSDVVTGMNIRYPDEDPGNTKGHHSFLLEFRRTEGIPTPPPINDTKERLFARLHELMNEQVDVVAELEKLL